MDFDSDQSLKEWAKDKPLSILQLDPADRAVLRIADERDAIQKKTFTKWVNKHLKKANRHVNDLFFDLQDGLNLISLLEVLSGEQLPREKGRLRFHMLQNVQMALDFLRYKKIKLVNIRAEDIVDGNPKLTLGLIWTIILHFQISDIVVGDDKNVSAKEALLKWARRSTAKYPGVRVTDFTSSWKDGLAFNAIIHRNRPDLIDWRNVRKRVVRERLENAFYIAEKEYGVTRLLDPEDVDTHEIDEKSLITYISSLYDVFPEPPSAHPLYSSETQQKIADYRDVASSLHLWLRERTSYMSDRNFPSTLIEMKKIAQESSRFRTEEMPARHRDKQRLQHIYRDLQKYFETVGEVDIEPELHIDVVERHWNRLMMSHQERDQLIHEEIKRLERLQRLAEKTHREIKLVDTRLEDLDSKIREETRRLERLHPLDAKHNVDILEQEIRVIEENIQTLFADVQSLRDGRYPQSSDLQKRVEKLHQRWQNLRSQLHTRLVTPLSTLQFPSADEPLATRQTRASLDARALETNPYYKNLEDCIEWCAKKLKQIKETEFAPDLPGVQAELNSHLREHNTIEQFHSRCEQCINAKSNFHGEELSLYTQQLSNLTKLYTELVSTSNKRLSDLETLQDFLQSASNHLVWLNEKEEIELTRDWSDRDLNPANIQQYYHSLMAELDKREIQFSAVQDRGESLLLQNHSAAKTIESFMTSMSNKWSWILQLTLALETHLKHASVYQQFFVDMKEADVWLNKRDELLNTTYSQSDFTLDEGERLLKGMQELREELNQYGEVVESLADRAQNVVPLKQRRQPVTRPIPILAVCNYKRSGITIEKCDQWVLHDNSGRIKWRVSNGASGSDCNIPGAVFLIPPPDKEALEAIDRLKRQFERTIALWQRKQLRMRQNMIFATIKVVKSWDLAQFLAMGADQRNAIRKALNEDAAKLLEEGDPADPQLRRLRREMDEVNRLFDEFERKSREEEENKNATRILGEQLSSLQTSFEEAEHTLSTRLSSPIPRDVDSLEHLVIQHKDFETRLRALTPDVEAVQETFKSVSRKTPTLQSKLERVLNQWDNLWNLSHLYVERMKCVEIVLNGLTEVTHILSDFEIKLASYGEMPSEPDALKAVHKELLNLQSNVTKNQGNIDQVMEDGHNTRRLVEKSRHHFHSSVHHDLDRLDADLNKVTVRWNNICSQLVDRLKSCEAAYAQLEKFTNSYQHEARIIEDSYQKLNSLTPPVKSQVIETNEPTKTLYKNVMQRVPAIEQVNIDGGKFIREAKIYDLRLLHYCDWLIDEVHPSLEASVPIKKKMKLEHISGSGEAAVSHDLDVLNNRFGALASVLYDRLKQLMILYPEDSELKELVNDMEPKPLKTFRTEFSIYEQADGSISISPSPKRLSNGVGLEHEHRVTSSRDAVDTFTSTTLSQSESEVIMGNSKSINGNHAGEVTTQFSELRSLRRINLIEDGMNADGLDILQMKGIVHPETNEILTVEEAIRLRILDVRTGKIAISPNSKSAYISIEEAVQRKLVIPELAKKLLGPCGILQKDGKTPMSLLEAIQRELTDAERGPMERLKVNVDEVFSAASAADEGLVTDSGGGGQQQITILNLPLALHDLLGLELVDRKTGRILDRDTGERCSLQLAIERRILDPSVREIVDAASDTKITVSEALERGILRAEKYHHTLSNERISFHEAKRRRLIIRPMSLKDSVDLEVLNEKNGLFRSPIYQRDLTLAEAIEHAVLDLEMSKTILDTSTGSLLTLSEALQDGTITANLFYLDRSSNELLSIQQATEQGFLFSVAVRSIFDMATIRADTAEEFVSFNDAFKAGVLKTCSGEVRYNHSNGDLIPLSSAADEGLIKSDMLAILQRNIGIYANSRELALIEAAALGYINSRNGLLVDRNQNVDVPFVEALKQRLINEQGVATLKSVLAITVSTQTITKTIVTYSTTVQIPPGEEQTLVNVDVSESSSTSEVTQRLREESVEHSDSAPSSSKSPEVARKSKRKLPIKEKIMKMLQPLEMKDARTHERHKLISDVDVPPEGWDLEVAVKDRFIDPTSGMLTIPGTDREVSFEECVKLEIINPKSAVVIEPHKGKKVSLKKALEKQILDCTGQYQTENEKLGLKEAIERSLIVFETSGDKTKAKRDVNLEPVRIYPNVIFDPETALVIFVDDNSSDDLCNAVAVGKIDPAEIRVTLSGTECSLQDVVQKGVIDLNARTCLGNGSEKISLGDAIKCGVVSVAGEPLVASKANAAAAETSKTDFLTDTRLDDDDEYVGPSLAQLTRTRVTTEPKYKVSIGKARSMNPNGDAGHPVLLQKIRKKKVKPKEAVSSGIMDESTADFLESLEHAKDSFGQPLTLIEALDLTNANEKLIKDPHTRDMISIREAVSRGIIEQSSNALCVLVPVARSLSLPDLVKQGLIEDNRIIHPETGEDLSLREAIVCDIVDPRSKIKDPATGNVLTLVDAMNEGVIRQDLLIKVENNELDVRVAMKRGDIFVDEASETMPLPPVAMTVQVAAEKGLYDEGRNLVRRPLNGEWIPLEQAVEEGLILPVTVDKSLQPAEAVCIPDDSVDVGFLSPDTIIIDKVNNVKCTLKEAEEKGTIDVKTGTLKDRSGKSGGISLKNAVGLGLLAVVGAPVLAGKALIDAFRRDDDKKSHSQSQSQRDLSVPHRVPMTVVAALKRGYYNADENKIFDDVLLEYVTLEESVSRRIIDPILTECKDARHDEFVSLERALETGLVDNGQLIHTVSGRPMSLKTAVEHNLIGNRAFNVTLIEAIEGRLYDPESRQVFDPCAGNFQSVREAVDARTLDVTHTEVLDCTRGAYVTFSEAVNANIVDADQGVLLRPVETSLDCAMRQKFIRQAQPKAVRKMTLSIPVDEVDGAESAGKESPIIASYAELVFSKKAPAAPVPNVNYTLEDCIGQGFVDPEVAVMRLLPVNKYTTVSTLLRTGVLNTDLKVKFVQSNNPNVSARKVMSSKGVLYTQTPIAFKDAVERGLLNTKSCRFKETTSGVTISLKDAVSMGFVESESALLKDGTNKRLLSLAETFSKGMFDSDKNTIIDTQSSRIFCLAEALKTELIVTEKLSLLDTLEYGLYNSQSGLFVDPFYAAFERGASTAGAKRKRELTLGQCVQERIVDADSIIVRDADGDIWSYEEAAEKLVLDPSLGKFYNSTNGRWIDLLEAKNRRYLLSPKARQAMEERYRLCDDTLTELLSWVGEIEKRVTNQDVVQEDLNQLRNQINILKLLKEEIDSQARAVTNCLDQVRQVVATGSEYLTRDEVNSLEKKGKQLRSRYDRANERVDKLLRRILAARDELTKFKNDLTVFTSWMEKAQRTAEEKQRSVSNLNRIDDSIESNRDFVSDVIAHQADLRFITMAAQKFVDESKEYLTCLNEFRTCMPNRLPQVEPILAQDSVVRNTVTNVTSQYRDLLSRVNALSDKLSGLGSKQKEYRDALNAAKNWLRDMDARTHKVLIESVAADPAALEDQLGRVRALNNELVSGSRLIDSTKQALDVLLRSVGDQLSSAEIANLKNPVADIEEKYRSLCEALAEKCQALDTALVQSQGVQDALDSLLLWLNGAENSLKNMTRPASLHLERLDDQMREYRVLQADVDSHKASVDSVSLSAQDLINTASNSRLAKKIETKVRDMTSRYDKLMDKTVKRGDLLAQVHQSLSLFNEQASHLERWLGESLEIIPEASANKIEDLIKQKEALKGTLDQVVTDGKTLINHKEVTDTANLRDKIKALDQLWKELSIALDEKHRNSKLRQEQLGAYGKLQDQVLLWLSNMESKINRLEPVAVEMETVKKQIEEIKPHIKEHRDYAITIDKVNDLGNALDSLNRPETPPRRRNAGSPTKRTTTLATTYSNGRRGSQDSLPSPSRGLGYVTQSPGGSSGFGSRRSSQDGFLLDDLSEVQQQLNEINNRYSLLNVRLTDRQSELESIKEELRKHLEYLRQLSQFLDKIQRSIPKETIPETKLEADKLMKNIKTIVEEIYEKQAVLESTKTGVKDLLRKKPTAYGADILETELHDTVDRWKSLHDTCKDRIQILEDVKDFHDSHDNLVGWLNSKDRIMTVLGPISSDSRMVQSQVQQVQVLREEFRTQQPQLDHFVNLGENILTRIPDRGSADVQKISTKLSSVQKRWNDLLSRLDERAQSLGAAADSSREFDAGYMRLKDALQNISDQLDDIPLDKEPEEQLRKVQSLERQLEGQRPLLADLEAAGAQLCEVLSDPTSRAEIQGKLSAVNRQYNNLQKKLDHRNAEIEALLRDGRQFESTCAQSLGWLRNTLGSIPERLLISADREVLQQQLEQHEPIYKEVMNKEHEIIMLLNKGEDLLTRSGQQNRTDTRNLQKDLDKIQQQWDKLRKDAVDRQTRLQTCWEHCKKYYRALETFIPWLSQAENKLDSLKPDTYKRTDVEKQLRELSLFRNDVWKHSGEFENLRTLGETFVAACDVDKELVKQELAAVKARWDKLNNELLERTQWLEDTARRLADFSESLRDLTHSVQRCEDKLASHDSLGGASRDPKILERIKNLREESVGLKKPVQSLRQTAQDLVEEASELGVGNASHLLDDVDNVTERLNDLLAKLDDRCSQLQSASTALAQYNEKIRGLSTNLSALDHELDSMKPIGRDSKAVRAQLDDIIKFIKKVVGISDDVQNAVEAGEHLVDAGFSADTSVTREQTEGLIRQLNRLDERARSRESDLEAMLEKLQDFTKKHTAVMDDIVQASEELFRLKPVGSEVEVIKSQQEEFQSFRKAMIEPLTQSVDAVNKTGQGLIQSAVGGVNTSGLEKDLEKMNDKWNSLKDKLNERDRKLDVGLLQSGKFQEALDGLAKWLTDTEDMIANQKPPSADYKVVKAQLQEQKFLNKMLLDRQNSMSSLFAMGNEVAAGADPNERKAIERQLQDLMQRFDNLTEGAAQRMLALEQAMVAAKEFQDKLVPLLEWLDGTEKKIKDMELIPTDEEKIQQRIREHDTLHKDILRKKPVFTELTEVASHLMTLVGDDEAAGVADKLQDTADRYTALLDASDGLGQLLQASRAGLRHLVLTYQDLQAWMESMDNRLNYYKTMPVHTEKLLHHMEDLADVTEDISNRQSDIDSTVDSGLELMKHISNDEAIQLKDKLDSLQRRYHDLVSRGNDLLKSAQETLPLVQQFHNSHTKLVDWMMDAESQLQVAEPREEEIARLEIDIQEFRPVLENINLIGPQLCQISPGEGAATIEGLVTRDNRRFDAIVEQIQRKAERIHLSKQRSLEVMGDIDELLDWFREVENQLRDAEPPSAEPDIIRLQLKEHKALNDDISSQKSRVRDVLSTAKKVLRESVHSDEFITIREKMEDLKDMMDVVSRLSSDRLGILEQAFALAEHFHSSHIDLSSWLDDMERQVAMLAMPALRPDLIAQQQDRNEMFVQSINEHKPLVEKLNKTGEALVRLVNPEEGAKVQDMLDADNARYAALRLELRQRQQALEKALQETSKLSDKLEGMLRALQNTAEQVSGADPISAHPPRIRDQIDENQVLVEDLGKREEAFLAVKKAANDVISKAPNAADPAVKDMKCKLEKLNGLWNEVQKATTDRGRSLEDALALAEKFWDELHVIMTTLKDLQESLNNQEPPAVQPGPIQQQQVALQEIRAEIDQTKPEVEQCRVSGQQLMKICGEPDKPEVKKHIEDLDNAWDNITALFAKREENLINAMEKAMEFHETLQGILDFLEEAEKKFAKLGPLGSDIDAVKRQIQQLKQFKLEVDPHMVKVEALNRQAQELTERTSAEQAAALKEPLASVNRRWDDLLRGIVERQRQLENALLRLGQFQHALQELLTWIDATDRTLETELKPVAGDPQLLEVELAKLKVLVNDIQAHQSSVDTLNDAGRQIIESGKGTDEASTTQDKLSTLNRRWRDLLQKAADRQLELEDALRDAQRFAAEIQDLLSWLGEVDGIIAASKPVGGLPETASEQLERFMEVYNELEDNRPKVETVLAQGQEYLKKSQSVNANNLQHNLKTLKQRWDSVTARANDKKIKLEIALKEATEFHDALQSFIDWLTNAEKLLTNLKPVSRVLATILSQIEEHKSFQKDVSSHREAMLHLDKKGTHLKYFSQKQDVILIKNLLISVQHRWERVVAKSAERTRALDHGYKEAREFHDAWSGLMNWLTETEKGLDELAVEASSIGNAPDKIKQRLVKHREFQRSLSGKQATYDATMRMGKGLKEKAPKMDEPQLRQMMSELKEKWNAICAKSVDRQRKLEEALLYCGQFKDALEALLDWLKKAEKELFEDGPVHGDLDTVSALIDQHKSFEQEFYNRAAQLETVKQTASELIKKANATDAALLETQLSEVDELWDKVKKLADHKSDKLLDALKDAEELHRSVHMLLEWLSDAEMKLRFAATLPEDDSETRGQLCEHEKFLMELAEKGHDKDATITLAQHILEKAHPDAVPVIKHWITIIQSRWDEVSSWAKQREDKLKDHVKSLEDLDALLEELLSWLQRCENQILDAEARPLPEDIEQIEKLIEEHTGLMEQMSERQQDVDTVCKTKPAPLVAEKRGVAGRRPNLKSSKDNLTQDKHGSRWNLKEKVESVPHIGPRFPPKGGKGTEPAFRNPRCKQLYDKWRNVWLLAWERQRRLQERLSYQKELEKVRNFSWDDWRKRFLKFINHKKSRLTDLFRKMDKNNDGLVPREDFIDGIMKTKFDTSKLEMNAVADMFDHDGAGLIDWKEFIAALRPDWEEKRPPSEAEKIHDEVKRLVMLCTCRQKFRVFQVGEGKYRFGDSQKLRLVRILRSTVMVRVGGGWVALDEFLVKNDPCRVEMLPLPNPFIPEEHEPWCPYSLIQLHAEEFLSQLMPIFESLRQHEDLPCCYPIAMGNPRQQSTFSIRERTVRSVPLGKTINRNIGTPDSLSDNETPPYPRTPARRATPTFYKGGSLPGSRGNSRPASRQGSKPPSRHGSNLSLDSTDDGTPSRIPRRSSTSKIGSGLSSRKPAWNGSLSSNVRSPSGVASPVSDSRSGSAMHRASSIPTLSATNSSRNSNLPTPSSSHIPLSIRLKTPSGSSTPAPSSSGSRLQRKSSTASESSRKNSKTPTPTDLRAPFRL